MAQLSTTPAVTRVVETKSPYSAILKLATPTVFAMLSQSIVNEIDAVFFAHLPAPESSNGQAALFPCLLLLWIFGGSLSAISVGTQAFTARRFAERRHADAGAVLVNAAIFSLLAGIVFTALAYLSLPWILPLFIKVPAVRDAASGYLGWRMLGVTSMAVTFAFKAFFDGIGKTHVHLVSAIIMNVINVVLCWALIFGNLGAPRMGVEGAGLAGFIATYIGLAVMVGYALLPTFRGFQLFAVRRFSKRIITDVLKLSVPSAIATVAVMTGFMLFAFIVSKLDAIESLSLDDLTLHEAVNSAATTNVVVILKLTFTACLGFGTATATLVSQSLGQKNPDAAARFGWASVKLGLIIFGVVGFLQGVVFTQPLLALMSKSEAVREAALLPMRIMGVCTPMIAVGMILTQALFGAGNSRFVMIVELILHFTCLVPLAWLLGITLDLGLVGIWSAAVVYVVALSSIMTWKFWRGDWKEIRL